MTKRVLALSLMLALFFVPLGVAVADGTITILGGVLSTSLADFSWPDQTVSASNQIVSGYVDGIVDDRDGDPSGWNIQILGGPFETAPGAGDGWTPTTANAQFQINLPVANTNRLAGVGGNPATLAEAWSSIDGVVPLKVASCDPLADCGPGDGLFELRPRFRMVIPAFIPSGVYVNVMTWSVILGP